MLHALANRRPKPLHVVAAILGEEAGNLRGWLYRLRKDGYGEKVEATRQGREVLVDPGSIFVLRLMGECLPAAGTVRGAMTMALELVRAMTPHAAAAPPFPLDLFAVRAWGKAGSAGFICGGRGELGACVTDLGGRGWPHVDVINLSEVVHEVVTGLDIVNLGAAEARRQFEEHYLPRLAEEARPRAVAMFDEIERRLAGRRRPAAAANESWTAWAAANAA
jgi:hypothetical protein